MTLLLALLLTVSCIQFASSFLHLQGYRRNNLAKYNSQRQYAVAARDSAKIAAAVHNKSPQNTLLDGVVRIYCTHSEPNFSMPWQRLRQVSSTSSGFILPNRQILTNAHAVEYGTVVLVKNRRSEKKYVANILAGKCIHVEQLRTS
jgi:hypothetical protein